MPVARFQMPDGRIARFEVPEGTTPEQAQALIQQSMSPEAGAKAGPVEPAIDPTEGMSGTEKFLAGVGKGMVDLGRGAGQLVGLVDQETIDEAKRLDAPLMKTGAGTAGNIAGTIATALPAAFIPGANTLAGSALIGGGLGLAQPVASGDSRLLNTGMGAAGGAAGQLAGRAVGAGYRAAKGLVQPFFKSGQKAIASRTLGSFAGNADDALRNMSQAGELVPGSAPTMAEVSKDAGIAQLQRSLANSSPQFADDLAQRALDQNAARMAALSGVSGSADDLTSAIAARSTAGKDLYEKAFSQTVRVDEPLKKLTSRPSMQSAIEKATKIAEEEGSPLKNMFDKTGKTASVRGLHYVKMALDDMLDDATSGLGKTEQRAIMQTRSELLSWLEKANPSYGQARKAFSAASKPINQMEVGQELVKRATGSQLPNVRGDYTLFPSAYGNAIKNADQVAKRATGMYRGLDDVFTPEQLAVLESIKNDLARSQSGQNLGRAVGSNTGQNLASQNLLRQVLGPLGLPESLAESSLAQTLMRPAQFAMQVPEAGIRDQLAKAMLDPKYGAQLMQASQANPKIAELIKLLSQTGALTGAVFATQ